MRTQDCHCKKSPKCRAEHEYVNRGLVLVLSYDYQHHQQHSPGGCKVSDLGIIDLPLAILQYHVLLWHNQITYVIIQWLTTYLTQWHHGIIRQQGGIVIVQSIDIDTASWYIAHCTLFYGYNSDNISSNWLLT